MQETLVEISHASAVIATTCKQLHGSVGRIYTIRSQRQHSYHTKHSTWCQPWVPHCADAPAWLSMPGLPHHSQNRNRKHTRHDAPWGVNHDSHSTQIYACQLKTFTPVCLSHGRCNLMPDRVTFEPGHHPRHVQTLHSPSLRCVPCLPPQAGQICMLNAARLHHLDCLMSDAT